MSIRIRSLAPDIMDNVALWYELCKCCLQDWFPAPQLVWHSTNAAAFVTLWASCLSCQFHSAHSWTAIASSCHSQQQRPGIVHTGTDQLASWCESLVLLEVLPKHQHASSISSSRHDPLFCGRSCSGLQRPLLLFATYVFCNKGRARFNAAVNEKIFVWPTAGAPAK